MAGNHLWRGYYVCLGVLGIFIFVIGFLSLPDQPPKQPDKSFDWKALLLALGATTLPFYACGALVGVGFLQLKFLVPITLGVVCLVALFAAELRNKTPLAPIKPMLSTFPIVGALIAMFGG